MPSPVHFQYVRESCETCELPSGEQVGFLAQQLERHLPEAVEESKAWGSGPAKIVNYVVLILLCYNAIRQLDKRVRALEARLGSTEAKSKAA